MTDRAAVKILRAWRSVSVIVLSLMCTTGGSAEAESPKILSAFYPERESANERMVQVDVMRSARCFFGDLDLVMNDLEAADGTLGLQLTVEAIGTAQPEVYFAEPLEHKHPGSNLGTYEVALPKKKGARIYGVFLCSVREFEAGKNPCSQQLLQTFDTSFAPYRVDSGSLKGEGGNRAYTPPTSVLPKVYFAQYFVDTGSSLSLITDAESPKLRTALLSSGIGKGEVEKDTRTIRRYAEALGSNPLQWNNKRLQIHLPFFSETKCNG